MFWDWLSSIADIASLAALPASVYAAVRIAQVRRRLVFLAQAGDILRELRRLWEELDLDLRENRGDGRQMRLKALECVAVARSVTQVIPAELRARIERLRKLEQSLGKFSLANRPKAGEAINNVLWNMHADIAIFLRELDIFVRDQRMGGAS